MTTTQIQKIQEQVQAGIDARLENPTGTEFDRVLAAAGARMLGMDGASIEEAARQAKCAGGPPLEVLVEQIRVRRQHPSEPGRGAA